MNRKFRAVAVTALLITPLACVDPSGRRQEASFETCPKPSSSTEPGGGGGPSDVFKPCRIIPVRVQPKDTHVLAPRFLGPER